MLRLNMQILDCLMKQVTSTALVFFSWRSLLGGIQLTIDVLLVRYKITGSEDNDPVYSHVNSISTSIVIYKGP